MARVCTTCAQCHDIVWRRRGQLAVQGPAVPGGRQCLQPARRTKLPMRLAHGQASPNELAMEPSPFSDARNASSRVSRQARTRKHQILLLAMNSSLAAGRNRREEGAVRSEAAMVQKRGTTYSVAPHVCLLR